ncbi:hypothetical protein ABTF08_19860, partial [Acinetobacter baumannii]
VMNAGSVRAKRFAALTSWLNSRLPMTFICAYVAISSMLLCSDVTTLLTPRNTRHDVAEKTRRRPATVLHTSE